MSTTTDLRSRRMSRLGTLLAVVAVAIACFAAMPAGAAAAPKWDARTYWGPSSFQPGGRGGIRLELGNVGDETAEGWPRVEVELPEGLSFDEYNARNGAWFCSASGSPQTVVCEIPFGSPLPEFLNFLWVKPNTVVPGAFGDFYVEFTVDVAADAPTGLQPLTTTLSGSGATEATTFEEQIRVGGPPSGFGVLDGTFKAEAVDENGAPYTQAGGHPFEAIAGFSPSLEFTDPAALPDDDFKFLEMLKPVASFKDLIVDLPAGFTGDPLAVPTCTKTELWERRCPPAAQVGTAEINQVAAPERQMQGIYNVAPSRGSVAEMMFRPVAGGPVLLRPVVRSDGSWALSVQTRDISEANPLFGIEVRLWGIPADASHDSLRCETPSHVGPLCAGYDAKGNATETADPAVYEPHASSAPRRALLTMPTQCDGQPDVTTLYEASWLDPARFTADGDPDLSDPNWVSVSASSPPLTGCEALDFDPSIKARPTTNAADSPTGLEVDLHVPQNLDPDGLATAHLKDATVTLPEGLVINPSGANGLDACSEAQAHLADRLPDECPEAAKVGTVQVETPVLEDPLPGSVYVATPHQNPFGSLLALYVTIDDPKTGITGKLAGKVTPDPQTGRLTATFEDNPQVPFEDFKLDFFGGAAAALSTPQSCGTYSTTSVLTPWSAPQSGPAATPSDTYAIDKGANGKPCGTQPNSPSFEAGSTSPLAGKESPFVLNLRREDGSQRFSELTVSPPPGLIARLAGTEPCPDAALAAAAKKTGKQEQAAPSCPSSSEVGSVTAGAGSGPAPYYAHGKAYLSGPYKGAPISLAIITPAVAGPYDLGTIVVRTALRLDPKTAQVTAHSDPIPQILEGIPLNVRSVSVSLDRPGFTRNGTSCDETKVEGSLLSATGQSALLSNRFQLAECGRLGFKPKMALFLRGGTERSRFPALTAVLRPRPGDANIASVSVAMPSSEFLAQQHIGTVCTRVQFAADNCPKRSIYGRATVTTPLLGYKLTGPVYLRSSDNPLPDLVPDLRGPAWQPVRLEAAGRTDTVHQGIRNSFDYVPDAPFTKLVMKLRGGKKGLLENSRDICAQPYRATVDYTAHNGKTHRARPLLRTRCGGRRGG
jgi:hypothetical protein